jgi:hypothetical protein
MRELSATITRTALSACADLFCTLTTARIGRSSLAEGNSGPRSSGLRSERRQFVRGQKQNPRRSDDSSTSVRVYRNAVACTSVEVLGSPVHVARTCYLVQSSADRKDPPVKGWIQNRVLGQDRRSLSPWKLLYLLLDQGFDAIRVSLPSAQRPGPRASDDRGFNSVNESYVSSPNISI